MTLDELIQKLQCIREENGGTLPVLVTGFDSTGFDNLETLEMVSVQPVAVKFSHGPTYFQDTEYAGLRLQDSPRIRALHIA